MWAIITAICVAATAFVGACVLVAKAVMVWAGAVKELRKECETLRGALASLALELATQRGEDRLEVVELIGKAIETHEKNCLGRI